MERPSGCRFRSRCPKYLTLDGADRARCDADDPALHAAVSGVDDHQVACHFPEVIRVV
jgi:peptide/nickel transport system ATP-binding protein